jgi:acetolactate synthase I/II/III large subunit
MISRTLINNNYMFIKKRHTLCNIFKIRSFSLSHNIKQQSSGARSILGALEKHNFETAFGYSGGAVLPILDAFTFSNINFIMNRDEQCSGHAATGFSKSTGKIGLTVTTSGPGVTNLVTPLHDALSDGVPFLALTGQVPTEAIGTDAFQECPAVEITKACTKWSYQVKKGDNLEKVIDTAIKIMTSNRMGPVHIDLPKDIMMNTYDPLLNKNTNFKSAKILNINKNINNKNFNIMKLVSMVNKAQKPVIIAGHGCLDSYQELREFINKTKIPITTTLHAMGVIDEKSEHSLHMLGMHGSVYANYAVQNADLIIALGCRLDDRITGNLKGHAPEAHKAFKEKRGGLVHIDNSINQLNKVKKIVKPDMSICSDTKTVLDMLNSYKFNPDNSYKWRNQIKNWKKEFPFYYKPSENGLPKTQEVIKKIYNYVDKNEKHNDMIITTGVGNHQMMAAQFYRWSQPKSILTSGSSGTMGVGLPFAIGAQIANADKTVLILDGDGSFNMTLNDLGTVAENDLPIKIVIFNDKRQQMVHVWQKLFFDERFIATDNFNPDFVKLADAYGIEGIKCDLSEDIEATVELMFETNKPILVEFTIEPDICLPLVAPGKNLDEMITDYSKVLPMEGLAPS